MIARRRYMLAVFRRRARGITPRETRTICARRIALTFRRTQAIAAAAVERNLQIFVTVNPLLQFQVHHHALAPVESVPRHRAQLLHDAMSRAEYVVAQAPMTLLRAERPRTGTRARAIGSAAIDVLQTPRHARAPTAFTHGAGRDARDQVATTVMPPSRDVPRLHARALAARLAAPTDHDSSTEQVLPRLHVPFAVARRAIVASSRVAELPAASMLQADRNPAGPTLFAKGRKAAAPAQATPQSLPVMRWADEQRRVLLVWRKTATEPTTAATQRVVAAAPALTPALQGPAPTPVTSCAIHPSPGVRIPQPAFDAAMVDRLTDDVVRKIEKRVRIERERQGL